MNSRVFIAQLVPKLNLAPATKYGKLVYVLPAGDVARNMEQTIPQLRKVFAEFTGEDYLLPVGDPVIIGLAMVMAVRYCTGPLKVLRWNRQESNYDVLEIGEV